MSKKHKYQSIYLKILLYFLITLLPFYTLGLIINQMTLMQLKTKNIKMMQNQVNRLINQIENEVDKIVINQKMYIDRNVNLLKLGSRSKYLDVYEKSVYINEIINQLSIIEDSSVIIDDVVAFIPDMDIALSSKRSYIDNLTDEEKLFFLNRKSNLTPIRYYNETINIYMEYPEVTNNPIYCVNALVSNKELINLLYEGYPDGAIALIGDGFEVIVGTGSQHQEDMIKKTIDTFTESKTEIKWAEENYKFSSKNYFIVGESSNKFNIQIIAFTESRIVLGSLIMLRIFFIILIISSLLVIIFYSIYIYRIIEKPLTIIGSLFEKVQSGDFEIDYRYNKKDEFGRLFDGFYEMVNELKRLIQEVYINKLDMQKAELKQLQLQINPHFLYNSFNLLRRSIRLEDMETADKLSKYLGEYFRYVTKNDLDYVPLSFEYEHARIYTSIQSIRFGKRINVLFSELPNSVASIEVPRLSLQPIIENSFKHGLRDTIKNGQIEVGIKEEDGIIILYVEDNGKGIDSKTLSSILDEINSEHKEVGTVSGLYNIHRRLKLKYGSESGIDIKADTPGRFRVEIRFPAVLIKTQR